MASIIRGSDGLDSSKVLSEELAGSIVADSAGRVTMPYQPAFLAVNDSTTGGNASYGSVVLDFFKATKFNEGNHFNTSTSTFTAPITGTYVFNAAISCRTNSTGLAWWVNGGYLILGTDAAQFESGSAPTHPNSHIILKLAAGDTVAVANRGITTTIGRHHSWFSGHLLG